MNADAATPTITKRAGPSLVWLIPLVTAIVGGWLVVKTLSEQGPQATISFKTANGIEIGKTKVKYKNVDIGMVERVAFSDDLSHVVLTAEFNQGTDEVFPSQYALLGGSPAAQPERGIRTEHSDLGRLRRDRTGARRAAASLRRA